jgi:cytochrome c-type biogenesis protein
MSELFQAFLLGNSAILTNVCILPLYPGLMAFLAGNSADGRPAAATRWLGLFVLAGVLSLMTFVGWLLYLLQQSFGPLLIWLLPLIYAIVIGLGVLMLFGRNPFARLATSNAPLLRNPYASAYLYGVLLGPMTLPCAGPIIVTAFLLGASSTADLANSLLYFFAFGLGFGWPLVLLPFVATAFQRRFTGWMTRNYVRLTQFSGVLLIAIGLFGLATEVLPNWG